MNERVLVWDGCKNVRDLGGLRTSDGRLTHWRAVVRSDTPARLTAAGWSALNDYGIRTIISLRTAGMQEDELNFTSPYADLTTVQTAIEDVTDEEFVQQWAATDLWCTPLYYQDALRRWPEQHAAVVSAIARARPGGVLFHCVRGHDRTGIMTLLLLALVGAGARVDCSRPVSCALNCVSWRYPQAAETRALGGRLHNNSAQVVGRQRGRHGNR